MEAADDATGAGNMPGRGMVYLCHHGPASAHPPPVHRGLCRQPPWPKSRCSRRRQARRRHPCTGAGFRRDPGLDQRMEAYDQFKALYETARFEEALPFAQRVVELSEADRDREIELPIAYNNLGATQFQLSNYAGGGSQLQEIARAAGSQPGHVVAADDHSAGGTRGGLCGTDQHALAVTQFDRALAVSRRSDGLFNLAQLPLIETGRRQPLCARRLRRRRARSLLCAADRGTELRVQRSPHAAGRDGACVLL